MNLHRPTWNTIVWNHKFHFHLPIVRWLKLNQFSTLFLSLMAWGAHNMSSCFHGIMVTQSGLFPLEWSRLKGCSVEENMWSWPCTIQGFIDGWMTVYKYSGDVHSSSIWAHLWQTVQLSPILTETAVVKTGQFNFVLGHLTYTDDVHRQQTMKRCFWPCQSMPHSQVTMDS